MKSSKLTFWSVAIATMFLTTQAHAECAADAQIRFALVTDANSTNNAQSLQKVMDWMEKGWVVGLIDTDESHPAALRISRIWRVADTITTTFPSWRATNNPQGAVGGEFGSRAAVPFSWKSPTPVLANTVYFIVTSSDGANTMGYSGNVATNTANAQLLTFSSTLRGQVIDANGVVTADYHAGESILTHPVNRILAMPRVAYRATDTNQVAMTLRYYRNNMRMLLTAQAFTKDSSGGMECTFTNVLSSQPYLDIGRQGDSMVRVFLRGQRELDITYDIQRTFNLRTPISWQPFTNGFVDGSYFDHTIVGTNGFFKATESTLPPPAPSGGPQIASTVPPPLQFVGWND
ncbi:MAG: hypothetical protein V4481_00425 [Patescibacteria group bacterium]